MAKAILANISMILHDILRKNRALKNLHAGKRGFIVGNGPSLHGQNLSLLRGEVSLVVNSFHRHPKFPVIAPPYYVLADPMFWEEPERLHGVLQAIVDTGIVTKLMLPAAAIMPMARTRYGLTIEPHFCGFDSAITEIGDDLDLAGLVPPFGQNVVCIALMLALHLGLNPIYLVGCDHDWWTWTEDEYASRQVQHFFSRPDDVTSNLKRRTFAEETASIEIQRHQYNAFQRYARAGGRAIVNATNGGALDVFPRVRFEALFPATRGNAEPRSDMVNRETIQALLTTGVRAFDDGDFGTALTLFEGAATQGIELHTPISGLDFALALCLAALGQRGSAARLAHQALVVHPEIAPEASRLLGALTDPGLKFSASHFTDALHAHVRVDARTEAAPGLAEQLREAERELATGNARKALLMFWGICQTHPHHASARRQFAGIHWQLGNEAEAVRAISATLDSFPGDRDVLLDAVKIFRATAQSGRAARACEPFLRIYPDDWEVAALREGLHHATASEPPASPGTR
ncbi:MAG: hypothetical protein EXR75_00045 [Myxococcales bacterium]|nr:hypothetical protein [Myxococcales bacterium]